MRWIINQIVDRLVLMGLRLWDWLGGIPLRFWRILKHLQVGLTSRFHVPGMENHTLSGRISMWWMEGSLLLADLLGVPVLYETLADWVKFRTRGLNEEELRLARIVFGNALDYRRIRVDERAHIGCRQQHIAYVSFYMINSWGPLSPTVFIHELVHVWQYQQVGAVYLSRALLAQASPMGYNYGGVGMLKDHLREGLAGFNYEQQADIIADYYRLATGLRPQWGDGGIADLPVYQRYIEQLTRQRVLV